MQEMQQSENQISTVSTAQGNASQTSAANGYWSSLEVLGQANLTYIVTQTRDKIVFVDQHAAHERVAFERLMNAWKGGKN